MFCLISNAAYSMSINLDTASEAKLLDYIKKENVGRRYWPADVAVRLEKFEKLPDTNGSGIRYFVRAVGSYGGYVQAEYASGNKILYPKRIGKGTEGYFSKEELALLGVQLPE